MTYSPDELPAPCEDAPAYAEKWRWAFRLPHSRSLYDLCRELVGGLGGAIRENETALLWRWLTRWAERHPDADLCEAPSPSTFHRAFTELREAGLLRVVPRGAGSEVWLVAPANAPPSRLQDLFPKHAPAPPASPGPRIAPASTDDVEPPAAAVAPTMKAVGKAAPIGKTLGKAQRDLGLTTPVEPIKDPAVVAQQAVSILRITQAVDPLTDLGPCVRVACGIARRKADAARIIAQLQRVADQAKTGRTSGGVQLDKPGAYMVGSFRRILSNAGIDWTAAEDDAVWLHARRLAAAHKLAIEPSKDPRAVLQAGAKRDRRAEVLASLQSLEAPLRETGTGP